jgi:hypothetical protein
MCHGAVDAKHLMREAEARLRLSPSSARALSPDPSFEGERGKAPGLQARALAVLAALWPARAAGRAR